VIALSILGAVLLVALFSTYLWRSEARLVDQGAHAMVALLNDPLGCSQCDRGRLKYYAGAHSSTCPYLLVQEHLKKVKP
jgi:hypothetical protein